MLIEAGSIAGRCWKEGTSRSKANCMFPGENFNTEGEENKPDLK